jgi:hypothetical protein
MKKAIERLFREAVRVGNDATAVRVRKGEMEILADWTPESGWYWLGAADDVMSDLESGHEGGRIRNAFTAEAVAFRAAMDCPEPTRADRKAAPQMTAEEQADFDAWLIDLKAQNRKREREDAERRAAMLAEGRAAADARNNTPKPEPAKKRSGYGFPF